MSPVNGLSRLPGQILTSVHMENCSQVDGDNIQETKPKLRHIKLHILRLS